MTYCPKCGHAIADNTIICPFCGTDLSAETSNTISTSSTNSPNYDNGSRNSHNPYDTGSWAWALLGFVIPFVGFILYIAWKDSRPNDAKMARKGALINFIIGIILGVILCIIYGIAIISLINDTSLSILNCI